MKRMLPALLKLLLVLAAVSHGTATFCDITENKASVQCYGALGQSVSIHPLNTSFKMNELIVRFQDKEFFRYKEKNKTPDGTCQNRCQLMKNGTLRLDHVKKSDSGIYAINAFNETGKNKLKINISLTIQDPVSRPALSQLCLSHGEIRASCSSTGEDPQYSWTLNNSLLDGGVAFLSNETQTIILRRNVSGSITCIASNRVSSENTTQELHKCQGTATFCDITENKASVQCYGALGQSVSIYPLNTSFDIVELKVVFQGKEFLQYKEKIKPSDGTCQDRCQLMKNGTLRLDRVMKSDSGIYTINEFDKDGTHKRKRIISLTIQDPVSPPALSQLCLPHGEIRASCNSTGDPQYSWTLDDRPLDGRVAFLSDETQTVILRRSVSASITCTASNRVSSEHTTQELLKCPGTATSCDITEDKASVQCYGALGQSVSIYPLNTSFKIDMLEVFFQGKEFFRYKEKTKTSGGTCQNRCQLMKNGTLRLDHVMKSDLGIYTIKTFDDTGKIKLRRNISLTIQDPVSPPALSQLCLSHGEIRASCNSTGGDPQYSWTLNNSPLDGGVAFLSNETHTVILRRNVSGSITCTASNRVSSENTTQELLKCPDPVSPPALSQLCLSHGEIRASCNSTGEDPQYSWTLNNSPLDGRVAFLSNETHTVILRRNVSGSITCTASNRVSSENTTQELHKCPGTETFCDITETKALVQCYGALGRSVFIHPLNTSFEIDESEVFFQGKEFFRYKANRPPYNRTCQNRCQLMKNGTLRLDRVMKSDSGIYTIKTFDGNGTHKLNRNISLTIQDPVSPPALSQLCLSHGEIRASCSSTGDEPQYSWTLDDRPLDGRVAFLSNETHTVILRRDVSGSITCTASNRVSSEHTTQELLKCPGTATFCDITETKASLQCYGALGQSVSIHPLNTSFKIEELQVFFQDKEFFRYKEKTKTSGGTCQNRCQLMKNGTLRLDHVMKSDLGIYTIKTFDDTGKIKLRRNISLTIQDPVSPPALSQLCLSHGEIRASCSSTGEDPQYSWTLDDRPLDGGVAFLSNETQTLILRGNLSGSITCTASNRVSSERTTQELHKCPGTATLCNITENKALVQCYGALGRSVFIHPLNTSFVVFFQDKEFFRYKEKIKPSGGTCQNRCQLMKNGTLRLYFAMKSDSGIYTIEAFDDMGISKLKRNISLSIQDPVSPPALSQLCLPHGEIRASCTSTGEDPQYRWTLDNSPLDGRVAFLSDENRTIILGRNTSGSITCTASNRVSREHTTQELLKCPGTTTFCDITENKTLVQCSVALGQSVSIYPLNTSFKIDELVVSFQGKEFFRYKEKAKTSGGTCQNRCQLMKNGTLRLDRVMKSDSGNYTIQAFDDNGITKLKITISLTIQGIEKDVVLFVVLGVCLLLMVLLLGTYCLYKKKQKQAATSQRSLVDRCEDPQELVYCQVQVVKKKERPKKQEQDPQVVYGEVKVSGDSKAVRRTPNEQADTIYSGIRT
ncbi:hemicentin-2-like isoform X4 [Anguilla rostrata]|uniref:hemicentin-2-like isoform X4 n=1 Tax=Anguilla rostrata TaxID=7938 RepID=UPI0030CF763C